MKKEVIKEAELLEENRRLRERLESVEARCARAEEIMRSVFEATSSSTGAEFIRSLVKNFALTLKVRCALVGEVIEGTQRVKTLAIWDNGSFAENFDYDLEGTPCNNVVAQTMRYYPRDLTKLFPEDYIIAEMGVDSYLGVPIFDSRGNPIGVMAALGEKPFDDVESAKTVLSVFSSRVGAEMEKAKAQDALRESEDRYRRIIETTMEGVWIVDAAGITTFVNDRMSRLLGDPADRIVGTPLYDYMDEEARLLAASNIENKRKKGIAEQYDIRLRRRDGSYFWALVATTPVFDAYGRYSGVLALVSDITKRKQAEVALKASEERFRTLVETSSDWVWEVDASGRYTYASPKVKDLLGYEPRELIGKTPFDLMPEEEAKRVAGVFAGIAESRRPFELLENTNRHKDGRRVVLETSGTPIFDSEGAFAGYRGMDRDITEKKRIIDALLEQSRTLEAFFSHTKTPLVFLDRDFNFVSVNETYARACARRVEDFDGHNHFEFYPNEENEAIFREVVRSKVPYQATAKPFVFPDHPEWGVTYWDWTLVPILDSAGEVEFLVFSLNDVTEHKRSAEAIKRSEANLLSAQRIASIGSGEWSLDTGEVHWSDEMYRIFGVEKGATPTFELFMERVHPEDREAVRRTREGAAREGKGFNHDYRLLLPDGTERFVRGNAEIFTDPSSGARKLTGTVQDITEIKRAEIELREYRERLEDLVEERTAELKSVNEQLVKEINERKKVEKKVTKLNEDLKHHVERLEEANRELEAFSYSLAHDLRAPLRVIDGFSKMLLKYYGDKIDGEGGHFIDTIRKNSAKMDKFIRDLLDLARLGRREMNFGEVDMRGLAESTFASLKDSAPGRDMEFIVNPLPKAYGEKTMLSQVVSNLLSNAVKFTRPRDKAVIEVGGATEDAEHVYFVKDNGVGFDMEHHDRIFKVFKRLHPEDEFEGTGAGLAIIQRIIQRHGGRVWAEGVPDQGAVFYFTLPRRERTMKANGVKDTEKKEAARGPDRLN